jgi:hypothetical protein
MLDTPEVTAHALQVRRHHKSLNAPPLHQVGKRKDKEDDEGGDKSGAQDFQDPKNVINVIFGGDGGFPFKRVQKLTLREILSMEPATTRHLRYSEVPISFSRDDQWTSFSEPGKFLLILDPVVAGSQLTRVLIDGGSGLNLLFASTLKKIGLDISKMLTPSKAPFYGIVSVTRLHHSGQWFCQSPSGQKTTTALSTSHSRWRISTHTMLSLANRH